MKSYFYPTRPDWFENILESWKNSSKSHLVFTFNWFRPTTLPEVKTDPFWMYLYYSERQTEITELQRVVKFRVRVVAYDFSLIEDGYIDSSLLTAPEAKVWFKCDLVEEIKGLNGGYLHESDFKHTEGVQLLQAIVNSIAPVKRISPMVTVQSTWHCIND
jgi:hypothetical protein